MILQAQPDLDVVGEASDAAAAAVRLARALHPNIALLDIRMPGMDGIAATRRIVAESPLVKVIILTTFDLDEYAFEGLCAGASGFLLKNVRPEDLLAGIRSVAAGDAVLAPSTTRRLLDTYAGTFTSTPSGAHPSGAWTPLTPRERVTFFEHAAGLTNQEIASQLRVSEISVTTHITRILSKLGLRDRVQAIIFSYEHGLTRPPA